MEFPLQLTFHGIPHSDALEQLVRRHASKLETFHDRVVSCRVVIESPHKHKHEGRPFRVRVELAIPRDEIVVSREVGGDAGEDPYAAIDEAFDQAARMLEEHAKMRQHHHKGHERARHGTIKKLATYEGFGFIEADGDEIYFHRNAVLHGGFDRMQVGDRVRFADTTEEDGVHASTVALLPRR